MASDGVLAKRGVLKGHQGWVTAISTPQDPDKSVFISSSRDKRLIVWRLSTDDDDRVATQVGQLDGDDGNAIATPQRSLCGHSQAVQDCAMSSDGNFAMSASWDKTLRLWDLKRGTTIRSFVGHTSDVFSTAFSPDNRQIVSGSRDKTIKLWNTLAECKYTVEKGQHTDWVSCVRFSPIDQPLIVSCGWDRLVKVWNIGGCSLNYDLVGHTATLHTVAISPDGSLCASGGKDGIAMLWDANEGRYLSSLEAGSPINSLCFSPCNYWLCAATDKSIKVWSLESSRTVLSELFPQTPIASGLPWCTSLQWSKDGRILFAGTTTGEIHVYETDQHYAAC